MVFKAATFRGAEPQVETDHYTRASLEAAVSNALGVAGGIDASDVKVTATDEDVFLDGRVSTLEEIERATTVAQSVNGVHAVQNRILLSEGGRG
jgi:osmotically-inducible protein OsmY